MKKYTLIFLALGMSHFLFADPPTPPVGKRWVLNPDFSDEFNGTELDASKWFNYHPNWKGRKPGLFLPSQVSVKNGYMQIRGEKMEKDTIIHAYGKDMTFNIAGGAVVSKKSVYLGYYECRSKAAATTMSTTFWFSGGGGVGPNECDTYKQEWDIQECIGRGGDFKGDYFAYGMHSNAHYWYTDCDGEKHDHRAAQVRFEDSELASEDFHVYGGWWRDDVSASYYYDNRPPKHQQFYNKVSDKPMDKPMYMRLVSETYPFPWIELPNDEELADTTKNTVYYDWVRGYKLVDVDAPNDSDLNLESEIGLYDENVSFPSATYELSSSETLKIPFTFQANEDREIELKLHDPEGKVVAKTVASVYAGYGNMVFDFEVGQTLEAKAGYKLVASVLPAGGEKTNKLDTSTLILDLKN
ncbi:family 16 glycosylhydrolase [Flammeovirgaceae bacterium SG7u.111]|nr:family 16 glycosylhydrolase [Flammeovirgaceae bacterium SG7u.132]WPO38392.1 family 16 glycosylhydrolase [Flammeovirgaceae bacterium SG7u.111]